MILLKKKTWNTFLISLICTSLLLSAGIPSSRAAGITIEEEKKLGRETYEKLEKANALSKNQRVNDYIRKIGAQILARQQRVPFDFQFNVINSSAINAFATPGGYIYIFRGLIVLAENESELASVMAHEIAHANRRHINDMIEKSQKLNYATLAGVLAGALLGAGGGAGAALAIGSVAGAQSMSLKYSREHEEEADRFGMGYLTAAGYDPKSMVDFMRLMRRNEFYSNNVPSYFLTHPGTEERIRYLDSLVEARYNQKGRESIVGGFRRVQVEMLMEERNLEPVMARFKDELKKNPADANALYGLAVVQARMGQLNEAANTITAALRYAPEDADILRDAGIIAFEAGRNTEAIQYLRSSYQQNDGDADTVLYLGRAYEHAGDYMTALDLYRKALAANVTDDQLYYGLATAYGQLNNQAESHYYFGTFFKKKGKKDSALFHYRAALSLSAPDSERAAEIRQEIENLQKPPIKPANSQAPQDRPGSSSRRFPK
ncbi:MAG TPA: M48 family metalloprotease [Syntrophales bacterium]|nr:M48 family metalloprotease [Syntrophales bacterium]